mgnify:CR=1 FL=1
MKFYKFISFFILIYTNIILANDYQQEYKIEVLIFKNIQINTQETFKSLLNLPDKDIIKLYDEDNINNVYSNFSNISDFFIGLINDKNDLSQSYPKILFRDDKSLQTLNKLNINILKDKNLELLGSKSWIQTIPKNNESKFLKYDDPENKYTFYLKLYKKRFMHIHLMGYIDDELSIYINEEKRLFNEEIYLFDHPYFGIIVSINEI